MSVSRVDLHVHSKYSDRPSEWILRRIGAPECYTPPRAVYDTARRRGMQFVTISDHNCIDGALEIAHLPGTFVSNEVTAYFPDDGCKIHVLCWNITEAQFKDIQEARRNIVELRDYFVAEKIVHSCAHPLYNINDRLTIAHFEQLLVLFNTFETMNGGRNRRGNDLMLAILRHLDKDQFERIVERHRITPLGDRPWVKGFTGGSDDHSGVFIAKGYTECPRVETIGGFLEAVASGRSMSGGLDGTPLSFAHSLYSIGYQYYRDRFLPKGAGGSEVFRKLMGELFGRNQAPAPLRDRVSYYARRLARRSDKPAEIEFKQVISGQMVKLFGEDWLKDDFAATPERYEALNRQTFELSSQVANQLLFQFSKKFVEKISTGSVFGSLEAVSAAGPVLFGVAPYLFSFAHQNRDKGFLADVSEHFLGERPAYEQRPKKGWFTDTLTETNGVTTLIRKLCRLAEVHEHDLTLISVAESAPDYPGRVRNFPPVGTFDLPEQEAVKMGFPPFLDILDYCDRQQFNELIISTPGPAGLAALAAGRILGTRLTGIYHTDLPQYIRYYTEDELMEGAAWRYVRWFYDQMDLIFVPSRACRQQLMANGFDGAKLRLFPHGTDTQTFHARHRDPAFWPTRGAGRGPVVTYVGRVAREKDLDILVEVYRDLAARRPEVTLAVVGDGPYLAEMKQALRSPKVLFTGALHDEALSRAYASSDVFVFPSTTDTFGDVVLEAMASGLPVVVSDRGGACELVEHGRSGLVTRGRDRAACLEAVEFLLDHPEDRTRLGAAARTVAEGFSWDNVYMNFWNGRENARLPQSIDLAAFAGALPTPLRVPHLVD